jgi:hypothetical protein
VSADHIEEAFGCVDHVVGALLGVISRVVTELFGLSQ